MAKDFPGWRTAAHRGTGGQPQLRRADDEQRLRGRTGAGVRARARERAGRVHGGTAGGAGAAGVAFAAEEIGRREGKGGDS